VHIHNTDISSADVHNTDSTTLLKLSLNTGKLSLQEPCMSAQQNAPRPLQNGDTSKRSQTAPNHLYLKTEEANQQLSNNSSRDNPLTTLLSLSGAASALLMCTTLPAPRTTLLKSSLNTGKLSLQEPYTGTLHDAPKPHQIT
jgi:hypothetical protein